MKRKIILPIILVLALALVSYKTSFALFTDEATSQNNTFTAAANFNISPSISPSISPQISEIPISITPTPSTAPEGKSSDLFVSNDYTCSTGAGTIENSKGTVKITKGSSLKVEVTLDNALPDTDYQLWVNQNPGSCPLNAPTIAAFIHTDMNGDGSETLSNHPLTDGATKFWVSLVGGSDVLRSSAVDF